MQTKDTRVVVHNHREGPCGEREQLGLFLLSCLALVEKVFGLAVSQWIDVFVGASPLKSLKHHRINSRSWAGMKQRSSDDNRSNYIWWLLCITTSFFFAYCDGSRAFRRQACKLQAQHHSKLISAEVKTWIPSRLTCSSLRHLKSHRVANQLSSYLLLIFNLFSRKNRKSVTRSWLWLARNIDDERKINAQCEVKW